MKIQLLYFWDCPAWHETLDNLKKVVGEDADIQVHMVETDEEAVERQFVGSPTIRVNGQDLFPPNHSDYALACRVYQTPSGLSGVPTTQMIRAALSAAVDV